VQQQGVEKSYDLNLYKYRRLHYFKDLTGDAVLYQSALNYEVICSILRKNLHNPNPSVSAFGAEKK
jgi:hypothetical protein